MISVSQRDILYLMTYLIRGTTQAAICHAENALLNRTEILLSLLDHRNISNNIFVFLMYLIILNLDTLFRQMNINMQQCII